MDRERNEQSKGFRDSDDRYLPRWEVENRVLYQTENSLGIKEATTKDINCSGTCIRSDQDFQPDQKIKLTIYLDDRTPVTFNGRVRWIQDSARKSQEKQVGISFYNADQSAQDLILQYAFELNDMKLANHWFKGWNNQAA